MSNIDWAKSDHTVKLTVYQESENWWVHNNQNVLLLSDKNLNVYLFPFWLPKNCLFIKGHGGWMFINFVDTTHKQV